MQGWLLWLAQGFGLGRIPVAPGTFGSLAGLLWLALLLRTGNFWLLLALMVAGWGVAVWLCGLAEEALLQTDPGSVVLDEIAALPLCFVPLAASEWFRHGRLPDPDLLFSGHGWPLTLSIFLLFRVFDVLKPWPVHQSQRLPGGWGVVVDDVLAAGYVGLGVALAVLI